VRFCVRFVCFCAARFIKSIGMQAILFFHFWMPDASTKAITQGKIVAEKVFTRFLAVGLLFLRTLVGLVQPLLLCVCRLKVA
jgi:hypothetical protein